MNSTARKSLAELNVTRTMVRTWSKYTLEAKFAVGSQSHRWSGSPKTHLLRIETVLADADPKPGTYKVGDIFSASAMCDGNGQHTGTAYKGLDTDRVTCERCLKWLGVTVEKTAKPSAESVAEARAARQAEREAKAAAKAAKAALVKRCKGTEKFYRAGQLIAEKPCKGRASKTSDYCSICR